MKKRFYKDTDGQWKSNFNVESINSLFLKTMLGYLNVLDPFFTLAKEKCEFEFILSLLRFRGAQDAGWDPFENLMEVYGTFKIINATKLKDKIKTHYGLFVYGLIIEASMPYELLANLLNVIEGDRYNINNFPDSISRNGNVRPQPPLAKIAQLKSRAANNNLNLNFFDEFVHNKLRNAISHSDYSIHWPELRISNPFPSRAYQHDEWEGLVNKAFAYIEALNHLYRSMIGSYNEPELIDVHPEFAQHPNQQVTTIVREGYGLIGVNDNWTREQLAAGFIPHRMGSYYPYELALIEQGQLLMPPNRIEKFNKRIKYLPDFAKRYFVKKFRKKYGV